MIDAEESLGEIITLDSKQKEISGLAIKDQREGFYGIYFVGDTNKHFWEIECPCGEKVRYRINELPEVDTQMPCGNPKHWAVKYSPGRSKS